MPITIDVGDRVVLKKKHPCGGDIFIVRRMGGDVRINCEKCGAQIWLGRRDFEKRIKKILEPQPVEIDSC